MPQYLVSLYGTNDQIEKIITARNRQEANQKAEKEHPGYVVNEILTATIKL